MRKIIIALLLCMPFALAASPFKNINENTPMSLYISKPSFSYYPTNDLIHINVHVVNASGFMITNSTQQKGQCIFHLYNASGWHALIANMTLDNQIDFQVTINTSKYKQGDTFTYTVYCNSTDGGSFIDSDFQISTNSNPIEDSLIARLLMITAFAITFLIIGGVIFYKTKGEN